jgi:hypothetical protein
MISLENLFSICDNSVDCKNALYIFGEIFGNTSLNLSINYKDNYIYKYSNEWLYLIISHYPSHPYYTKLIELFKYLYINKDTKITINEDVVSFITSFSTGTAHGYFGLYNIIINYIENYDKYKNYKIIVAKDSQAGILNIIKYFCKYGIIDKKNIIYIKKNKIYHFKSIYFIENKYHMITFDFANKISELLHNFFIKNKRMNIRYKAFNNFDSLDNICIVKNSKSENLTTDGIVPYDNVIDFCNKFNFTHVDPISINEMQMIYTISNSKLLILSWGTTFVKNFYYISNKCEKIIVLIIGNLFLKQFLDAMTNNRQLMYKFKNANIIYKIVDQYLDFNPYLDIREVM